jgi:hypothetical protein
MKQVSRCDALLSPTELTIAHSVYQTVTPWLGNDLCVEPHVNAVFVPYKLPAVLRKTALESLASHFASSRALPTASLKAHGTLSSDAVLEIHLS